MKNTYIISTITFKAFSKGMPSFNDSHSEIYSKTVITILILISNPHENHLKYTEGRGQGFSARGTKVILVPGGNNF
jgi:hypothetical protein